MMDPFALASELAKGPDPFAAARSFVPSMSDCGTGGAAISRSWGGDKFPGSFGLTEILTPNYVELRARSAQLFTDNLFARGLIRRLVTNEINTGLKLQSEINAGLLEDAFPGEDGEEKAEDWAEAVEDRFELWANNPRLCDFEGLRTFAQLQAEARREALIEGDILVMLHIERRTGLPMIELVRGGRVVTPLGAKPQTDGGRIIHGVEFDARGRQVAYWVTNGKTFSGAKRVPAFGPRSKRRLAWLQYGGDKRMDAARGMPLLALVLQSLKEMDRYRDAELRAATINALLAMFIEKGEDKPGTLPISGGAIRRAVLEGTNADGSPRDYNLAEQVPGIVFEELQHGEVPHSFRTDRPNINYPAFETAVLSAVAWANEIPPEILMLSFHNNYSASKAAINEFKMYLGPVRQTFGATFCQPVYLEWLTGEVIGGRTTAPGFLEAKQDPTRYAELGAWVLAVWAGPVKPSVDLGKDVKAYAEAMALNLISATRASEDIFGVRYSRVLKRRAREIRAEQKMNEALGIVPEPAAPPAVPVELGGNTTEAIIAGLVERIQEEAPAWPVQ